MSGRSGVVLLVVVWKSLSDFSDFSFFLGARVLLYIPEECGRCVVR